MNPGQACRTWVRAWLSRFRVAAVAAPETHCFPVCAAPDTVSKMGPVRQRWYTQKSHAGPGRSHRSPLCVTEHRDTGAGRVHGIVLPREGETPRV